MNRKLIVFASLLFAISVALSSCGGSSSTASPPQPVAAGFTPQSVCRVPDVVGMDQAVAEGLLAQLGLQPVKNLQYDAAIAAGAVIAQRPAPDTRLEPCQGDVDLVVSRGEPPKPTDTPAPTNTPAPPTPTPTATPVPPTPTPTPDPRLFVDDFEMGINPDWSMTGDNFVSANGRLVFTGFIEGSIGDASWADYRISIGKISNLWGGPITVLFRVQDRDNHMKMTCYYSGTGYGYAACELHRVINGQQQLIPGTPFMALKYQGYGREQELLDLRIEAIGDRYHIFANGDERFGFFDNTFNHGGVIFRANSNSSFEIDGFEVTSLR